MKKKIDYWRVPVELGDRVSTSDGFTGTITAGEPVRGWKVKYDAPKHILARFKKKQYGFYPFKELFRI